MSWDYFTFWDQAIDEENELALQSVARPMCVHIAHTDTQIINQKQISLLA
jgi:hypothetical protein